jgi:hypothetical protein
VSVRVSVAVRVIGFPTVVLADATEMAVAMVPVETVPVPDEGE